MTPQKNSARQALYSQIDTLRTSLPEGDLLYTAGRLVPVQFHRFDSQKLGAVLIGGRVIVVNSARPLPCQRFSLAHELVHYFLHRGMESHKNPFLEWQANEGAAELLLPHREVLAIAAAHRSTMGTLPRLLARRFGVSETVARYKLQSLGLSCQSKSIDA